MKRIVLLLLLPAFWVACRHPEADHRKFLRFNLAGGLKSLDPKDATVQNTGWACSQLYNGLVQLDARLRIVPCIAKSWDISPDGLRYTFHLRHDVYFHDEPHFPGGHGRRVRAGDFVFSFARINKVQIAPDANWVFAGKVDSLNPFAAPNDSTFVLRLKKTFPAMLGVLSTQICSVVPEEIVTYYGNDFGFHPVGTGPFQLVAWKENVVLLLHRNPRYFEQDSSGRQYPYLDGIRVSFIDSKASEFLAFRQGQLDFISDLDENQKQEVLDENGNLLPGCANEFRLQKTDNLNTEYIGFNTLASGSFSSPAVQNPDFRRAFNLGIDRIKLVTYLRHGVGEPASHGFVSGGLQYFDPNGVPGHPYNPDQARKLIERLPDKSAILFCSNQNATQCSYLAAQLNQLGFQITVNALPAKTMREMIRNNQVGCFRASWIADYADAESFLSCFYSHYGAGPNYTRFHNPIFDQYYEMASRTLGDSLRNHLYMRMDSLLTQDDPVAPLFHDEVIRLVSNRVRHFYINAINLLDLRAVELE